MKKKLLFLVFVVTILQELNAQVTQINSNKSLVFETLLTNDKAIYVSEIDETLWASDGTLAGTIQLSTVIKMSGGMGSTSFTLNGKYVFAGTTPATGSEVYITDGTPGGTLLVKDINPGAADSSPDKDVALMNGFLYFTATRPAEGRELWRTDGTANGTTLVKDIFPGATGSNTAGEYELSSFGTYLLFAARTAAAGIELWRSDGSDVGTVVLKDINTGNAGADSSNPRAFFLLNSTVLFAATDATHGEEIWRTDGTPGGTTLLLDINTGIESSTLIDFGFGFGYPVFQSFHVFNNRAYFNAFDGTTAGAVWSTDGTTGNTFLLKDIVTGPSPVYVGVLNAINLTGKFIFPISDQAGRTELWQSDGTSVGTTLFKAFTPNAANDIPFILVPFSFSGGNITQPLFQGNKFFFIVGTDTEGNELWISDGTIPNTQKVKEINTGSADGIDLAYSSHIYTNTALYFPANNGINGVELWKTDGTDIGTSMVADIITGINGSFPAVNLFLVNGKVLFGANNGDVVEFDLYAVDGVFLPLPVKLGDFTVSPKQADAILKWRTLQELNSKNFVVQRSFNGVDYHDIGTILASGSSPTGHSYSFIDAGIMNSGKSMVYYRLLVADIDGKSSFSPVITLRLKNTGKWDVRLMANPVLENLKVMLSGITHNVQLSIVDMSGKMHYSSSSSAINGIINLPVSKLPGGIYTLLAVSNHEIKTIQFKK